jgi:hypothetical protein
MAPPILQSHVTALNWLPASRQAVKILAKNAVKGILRLFCKVVYRAKLALYFNGLEPAIPLVYLTGLWPALAYGWQTGKDN